MDPDPWLEAYSRRLTETLGDTVRAGRAAADRWARRAQDQDWTADSMTADAIGEWEEFTPLLGRWLDLGLEAAQRAFAGITPDPGQPPLADPESPVAGRAGQYQELYSRAAEKFRTSAYRSEDLVEDWLALSAKAAQDATSVAAAFWGRLLSPPPE